MAQVRSEQVPWRTPPFALTSNPHGRLLTLTVSAKGGVELCEREGRPRDASTPSGTVSQLQLALEVLRRRGGQPLRRGADIQHQPCFLWPQILERLEL